jgi:hypothetical protein
MPLVAKEIEKAENAGKEDKAEEEAKARLVMEGPL